MSTRKAAFAGSWYPAGEELLAALDAYMPPGVEAGRAVGLVAPHAGYVYSGATAGAVYARVAVPDRVVVMAPSHTGLGEPLAVWPEGAWATPLGEMPVDADLAAALLEACPQARADRAAHSSREHSLEIQLPFIKRRNPHARILPISVGTRSPEALESLGTALAAVAQESGGEVLLVASNDMTHFESAESARARDEKALDRVTALDPAGLLKVVASEGISMCGASPVAAMLWAARGLGATECELVEYTNSGAVTGDTANVVAYAGLIVT
jgi:AmmeMemoRadiSam system protein B